MDNQSPLKLESFTIAGHSDASNKRREILLFTGQENAAVNNRNKVEFYQSVNVYGIA